MISKKNLREHPCDNFHDWISFFRFDFRKSSQLCNLQQTSMIIANLNLSMKISAWKSHEENETIGANSGICVCFEISKPMNEFFKLWLLRSLKSKLSWTHCPQFLQFHRFKRFEFVLIRSTRGETKLSRIHRAAEWMHTNIDSNYKLNRHKYLQKYCHVDECSTTDLNSNGSQSSAKSHILFLTKQTVIDCLCFKNSHKWNFFF